MTEGPGHFLNELTMWKLKAVAEEFKIDVSNCRYKRDYVQKIASKKLTEEQVRAALERIKSSKPDDDQRRIAKELESIAQSPKQPGELPEDELKSVERHLDEALTLKPALFEVDSTLETALGKMMMGDYYNAVKLCRQARDKCLESFSNFQVYSAAMSIRSVDELLGKLADEKGDIDPILRTALAEAKKAFIDGQPKKREEALENLEVLATKAYDAYLSNTEKEEADLRGLLADYESFGTRTEESKRYLEIASQARRSMNVAEYGKLLDSARAQAEKAKEQRAKEIANSFHIVRAATAEAAAVGVETSAAEAGLAEATKAYEQGSFRDALGLLTSIERQVDAAHLEQIKARRELEAEHLETVRKTVMTYDPMFKEAGGYGIDVTEASYHIMNARAALARRDAVSGAKFARRIRELGGSTEKDLDRKRAELGLIAKVEGVKCENCGKEAVYFNPEKGQKCIDCGHPIPTPVGPGVSKKEPVAAESPPKEKRRFRLLRI